MKTMNALGALALCAALIAPAAHAAKTAEPPPPRIDQLPPAADEPVTDQEMADWMAAAPSLDWQLTGLVQGGALLLSNADADRKRSLRLRRARAAGVLEWKDWMRLNLSADLANGPKLRDASIELRGPVWIEVGRFPEPFGLLQSSSRYSAMMERPEPLALAPGYGLGAAASLAGESWGLTAGVFSATANSELDGGRKENALTMRATISPVRKENWRVHLGASASLRESEPGALQFVAIPESILLVGYNTDSAILEAGTTGGGKVKYQLYDIELASQWGPVVVEAEGLMADIGKAVTFNAGTSSFDTGSPTFFGFYGQMLWAVTKERRDYSTRRGTFGGLSRVNPEGTGAWEIAVRFSFTDLMDPTLQGMDGTVSSIGVNWYPDDMFKFSVDALAITRNNVGNGEAVGAIQARAQAFFGVH